MRYIILEESYSAHCCFKYSIIDTATGKKGEYWIKTVCECFEEEDAILICNTLNKLNI